MSVRLAYSSLEHGKPGAELAVPFDGDVHASVPRVGYISLQQQSGMDTAAFLKSTGSTGNGMASNAPSASRLHIYTGVFRDKQYIVCEADGGRSPAVCYEAKLSMQGRSNWWDFFL